MSAPAPTAPRAAVAACSAPRTRPLTVPEARWAAASLALFLAGLTLQLAGGPSWSWWAAYLACCAAGGWAPGLAGLAALRTARLDVDLLMVAASAGAAAIGQITDGALLIVIFATSGALEALATARTEDSVRGLLDLAPETATLLTSAGGAAAASGASGASGVAGVDRRGGDGERTVRVDQLVRGDLILVRPGERIAADGTVSEGASEVDQAGITGEPLPVDRGTGDEVFAGTLNGTGALWVRVTRAADESVVARIAALVEQAGRTKARGQLLVEKIEQRYSVGMVVATLAVFAIPLLAGQDLPGALLRAMTFMIVASPCAVVLATMPPLLAAIAHAGRNGVLVKSAVVMEQLGTTTLVAFDKTGTLTHGRPELAEVLPTDGLTEHELLAMAGAVERPSEHPLAAAVVHGARQRGVRLPEVERFTARPGRGVTGRVGGRTVEVVSPATLPGPTPEQVERLQRHGLTAVVVLRDAIPVGVLGLSDRVRAEAAPAVAALTALTAATPVLLTGDNRRTADRVAGLVGIREVHAGLLPEDKVARVRALEAAGHRVTVVGDGVNDAPALAAAHTGIAMGRAGADLAMHSADAVVVRDDLATIPSVIALSRRARRTVTANLVIAATFIAALAAWDLLGQLPLPLGVAGHEGSTVLVALNGLRLLRPAPGVARLGRARRWIRQAGSLDSAGRAAGSSRSRSGNLL